MACFGLGTAPDLSKPTGSSPRLDAAVSKLHEYADIYSLVGERILSVVAVETRDEDRRMRLMPQEWRLFEAEETVITELPKDTIELLDATRMMERTARLEYIKETVDSVAKKILNPKTAHAFRYSIHELMAKPLIKDWFAVCHPAPNKSGVEERERAVNDVFGIPTSPPTGFMTELRAVFAKKLRGEELDKDDQYSMMSDTIYLRMHDLEKEFSHRFDPKGVSRFHAGTLRIATDALISELQKGEITSGSISLVSERGRAPIAYIENQYERGMTSFRSLCELYLELNVEPAYRVAVPKSKDEFTREVLADPVYTKRAALAATLVLMGREKLGEVTMEQVETARGTIERSFPELMNAIKGEIWNGITKEDGDARVLDEEKARGLFPEGFSGMHGDHMWVAHFTHPITLEAIRKVIGSLT